MQLFSVDTTIIKKEKLLMKIHTGNWAEAPSVICIYFVVLVFTMKHELIASAF